MSCTRSKIVAQAQKWADLKEADGSFKVIIDTYNSHKPLARGYKLKYTDAWCSGFASAVAIACGATDIIPTEVGCGKHIDLFKKMNIWVEDDAYVPLPGDYIFYDWQDNGSGDNKGGSDHVGIVEKVENGSITVIEGNYNQAVKRRTLKVNGKYIRGYGVPKYDAETSAATKTVTEIAKEVIDGKWGNGSARKQNLIDAGYDYSTVQAKVNELLSGKATRKTVTEIAKEVIAGKWGNGATRKRKLTEAGYDYAAVQKKVNELLK